MLCLLCLLLMFYLTLFFVCFDYNRKKSHAVDIMCFEKLANKWRSSVTIFFSLLDSTHLVFQRQTYGTKSKVNCNRSIEKKNSKKRTKQTEIILCLYGPYTFMQRWCRLHSLFFCVPKIQFDIKRTKERHGTH